MKNKKLNAAAIWMTVLGMIITWCAKYALYFFRGDFTFNLLPMLPVQAGLLILFLVMWRKKFPKWSVIISLVSEFICFIIPFVIMAVNILNFPHFVNNLLTILPIVIVGVSSILLYMYWDALQKSVKAKITAICLAAAIAIAAIWVTVPGFLLTGAVVFDTDTEYTVEFISNRNGLGFVEVTKDGETETYYQRDDGKFVAHTAIHQVQIPKEKLRGAEYKVGVKSVLFTVSNHTFFGNTVYGKSTAFRNPVSKEGAVFFAVSDIHTQPSGAVKAIEAHFDELDFIACLGDLVSFSGNRYDMAMLVNSMAKLSRGEIPVVYTRGNHELMGEGANAIGAYIPTPNGEFYYTFAYNNAYFIVNDFAADKGDDDHGFSGLSDGEQYRVSQTEFVREAIEEAKAFDSEYVVHMSHIPVSTEREPLKGNMSEIAELLKGTADVSICGHTHKYRLEEPSERIPFPVMQEGGNTKTFPNSYVGGLFRLADGKITVDRVNAEGEVSETIILK